MHSELRPSGPPTRNEISLEEDNQFSKLSFNLRVSRLYPSLSKLIITSSFLVLDKSKLLSSLIALSTS